MSSSAARTIIDAWRSGRIPASELVVAAFDLTDPDDQDLDDAIFVAERYGEPIPGSSTPTQEETPTVNHEITPDEIAELEIESGFAGAEQEAETRAASKLDELVETADANPEPEELEPNTPVRFVAERLGCLAKIDSSKFEEEVVHRGDYGTLVGLHPAPRLKAEGWLLVAVRVNERDLFVPCHRSQIERAS